MQRKGLERPHVDVMLALLEDLSPRPEKWKALPSAPSPWKIVLLDQTGRLGAESRLGAFPAIVKGLRPNPINAEHALERSPPNAKIRALLALFSFNFSPNTDFCLTVLLPKSAKKSRQSVSKSPRKSERHLFKIKVAIGVVRYLFPLLGWGPKYQFGSGKS